MHASSRPSPRSSHTAPTNARSMQNSPSAPHRMPTIVWSDAFQRSSHVPVTVTKQDSLILAPRKSPLAGVAPSRMPSVHRSAALAMVARAARGELTSRFTLDSVLLAGRHPSPEDPLSVHFQPHGHTGTSIPVGFRTLVNIICKVDPSVARIQLLIGGADAWYPDDFPDRYGFPSNQHQKYTTVSRLYDPQRCPSLVDVRAQNLNATALTPAQRARTAPLPIGLDLHTVEGGSRWGEERASAAAQLEFLRQLARAAPPLASRVPRVVSAFPRDHPARARRVARWGPKPRSTLRAELNSTGLAVQVSGARRHVWESIASHAFVASPHGLGSDAHRTWEAMLLGCIVIVQHDSLAQMLAAAGLPVVTVRGDAWGTITPQHLKRWLRLYGPRTVASDRWGAVPWLNRSWWLKPERLGLATGPFEPLDQRYSRSGNPPHPEARVAEADLLP